MKKINNERTNLNFYAKFYNALKYSTLSLIFPVNKKNLENIYNKIERLYILRNIFLAWLAEYKLSENANQQTPIKYLL